MMRKIVVGFVAGLVLAARTFGADTTKPNIVMLLADDLGYHDVSFNGRKEWATPNMDKLGAEGTIYHRWYTGAVICGPSRAALMTGRYSIHNGVLGNGSYDLPSAEVTIAEALKGKGYATGLFGKWHAQAKRPGTATWTHPMDQGFDEFFGYTNATKAWQKFPKELWDGRKEVPVKGYADTLFTDRAIDFMTRHKSEPFFLYLPFIAPHGLQEAPPEDIAEHVGFKEKDPAHPYNAIYAAQITRMDKEVGRVMKALDDLGLTDNTLVVFSSDHGATFETMEHGATNYHDSNYPFRGQKRTLWEGGTRVPGIVRWPGHVPAGKESEEIIHMIDLFPTFCAAAGFAPDPAWKVDGVNELETFEGKAPSPKRTMFWEWDESGAKYLAALHGNMKMMMDGGNRPELYDVVNDPAERRDISAEYPEITKKLHAELEAWLATTSEAAKQSQQHAANKKPKIAADGHSTADE
ncbi:MAG TPA: sulfatase-like hydrolase/transferase [Tepidisphaeraceae bacterium]|jgi:arylsulfatase A-like enzyme|nr:sulfatase-like hydrolase/transferase [Tepidisphaeraceae bacterium]